MKHVHFLLPTLAWVLTLISLDACSSTTDPGTKDPIDTTSHNSDTIVTYDNGDGSTRAPSATRRYDSTKGGVQITAIYYNQGLNETIYGLADEWVVLQAARPTRIAGWRLNAGDAGQDYPQLPDRFPDTISGSLTIYTHEGPTNPTTPSLALHIASNRWIWNNAEPDTARLYDSSGAVVSTFTYDVP